MRAASRISPAEFLRIEFSGADLNTRIEDTGLDSLDYVELLTKVEAEFEIEIPNGVAKRFETIGDIATWLEAQEC